MADPIDFPTYATLTQAAGWADTRSARIHGEDAPELAAGPRYTEGALLGKGGMGVVSLARDERIGREVAVKELHTNRAIAGDERARFLREARVQGQLEHPSIVPVYDIDRRPDGTVFFTMRRVVGRTLHAIVQDLRAGVPAGRYTQRELLTAFATICLAVDYAHSRGVVHRDLKPANLMLGDFGEVYVLDWGLARLVDATTIAEVASRLSTPGDVMGTPLYMAPEQLDDPEVGPAADVFALGTVLFELLALVPFRDPQAPFELGDARLSHRVPERGIAPELEAICVTATAEAPAARFASARALQEAVVRYLDGDRDRELRHARAAEHARAAREALARSDAADADHEAERSTAMREIARALAFDPSDREHVAMLADLFARPPRKVPPEVRAQVREEAARTIRTYARAVGPTLMSWAVFLPIAMIIGVHSWAQVGMIAVPAVAGALAGFFVATRSTVAAWRQVLVLVLVMLAMMSTTCLYGWAIVAPTFITGTAVVIQAFPTRLVRTLGVVCAVIAMALPVILELAGVTTSYLFDDAGHWIIVPRMVELPRLGTAGLVLALNAGAMIVPCVFIAALRRDLSAAQERQLLQSWHFRRLGDQLMQPAE